MTIYHLCWGCGTPLRFPLWSSLSCSAIAECCLARNVKGGISPPEKMQNKLGVCLVINWLLCPRSCDGGLYVWCTGSFVHRLSVTQYICDSSSDVIWMWSIICTEVWRECQITNHTILVVVSVELSVHSLTKLADTQ